MPFYEFQYAIQDLVEILKEKNDAERKQNEQYKQQQKQIKKPKNQLPRNPRKR